MSTKKLMSLIPAAALLAGGVIAAAPSSGATTAYITATTAGTKPVGQNTYVWGNTNALPGTKICDQVLLSDSRWSTSQCSTVKSDGSYTIPLTYGITSVGTNTFRVTAAGVLSPSVTLTRTPSTSAPTTSTKPDYINGQTTNGYTLYSGYNGSKVYLVQKALGIATSPMNSTMGPITTGKVAAFQKAHAGLRTDGVVDAATFYALKLYAPYKSYLAGYNFDIDAWSAPAQISSTASRTDRVNAMVAYARAQLGKPYIWGGTGPMGFDCSGFLLQAMRAAGFQPKNVNNFTNIRPASDLSNQMWRDSEFTKGSLSNIQYGDFIYYGGSDGVAHHVAMYVGNDTVINAVGSQVQYSSLSNNFGWSKKLGVNRMP